MASAAQVRANRANAQKSTGPRTAGGKERASRNAVKHGLLAREAVIPGEDAEEFEVYREGMLADLAPTAPVEAMLAERIVGLSWRLRRAERLQNEAFAALDDGTPTPLLDARLEEWKRLKGSDADRRACGVVEDEFAWGRVVVEDFTRGRVLDRLLLYERRIESSLYRTMGELRRLRAQGQARVAAEKPDGPGSSLGQAPPEAAGTTNLLAAMREEVSGSEVCLQAGREPATATKLGSFGANVVPGSETRGIAFGYPEPRASDVCSTGGPPAVGNQGRDAGPKHPSRLTAGGGCPTRGTQAQATQTPDGITRNPETPDAATTSPVAHHSSIPSFHRSRTVPAEPLCETKPIGEVSSAAFQVSSERGRTASPPGPPTSHFTLGQGPFARNEPNRPGGRVG